GPPCAGFYFYAVDSRPVADLYFYAVDSRPVADLYFYAVDCRPVADLYFMQQIAGQWPACILCSRLIRAIPAKQTNRD
ncbi:MAG: hypothetical protein RIF32_13870, partial [Leptospirales bacterium]